MNLTTCNTRPVLRPFNRNASLFDDFFAPFAGVVNDTVERAYQPSVDIYERDEKLCIEAELPGFNKKDIKVDVKGRVLTLGGERVNTNDVEEASRFRNERRFGRFERTFKLPFEVSEDLINATYQDGILTLVIDKPEEQKPKQITIN